MRISETVLPGVGKKHELALRDGNVAAVITHNTGKRELLKKEHEDADAERLFDLTDQESRTLGTVLEGAYFQPVASEDKDTILSGDTIIEWLIVGKDAPALGDRIADALPEGVKLLAIERGGELLTGEPPETTFEVGDVVIIAGGRDACTTFENQAMEA